MKRLPEYINEKLNIRSAVRNVQREKLIPKSYKELKQMLHDIYEEHGPGTENDPVDFTDIDVSNVKTFFEGFGNSLFSAIDEYNYIDVTGWDTSKVRNMSHVFANTLMTEIRGLETWDTSNVDDMRYMFLGSTIKSLDNIKDWNVSSVHWTTGMFMECEELEEIDLSKWNLKNVYDAHDMFAECTKLKTINITNLNTPFLGNAKRMFADCKKLKDIIGLDTWSINRNAPGNILIKGIFARTPIPREKRPEWCR